MKRCPWCRSEPEQNYFQEYDKIYLYFGCFNENCPMENVELFDFIIVNGSDDEQLIIEEKTQVLKEKWNKMNYE